MDRRNALGQTVEINGIELYYEEQGQGEALLLLHGFTGAGADFAHVFDRDALAREYRVIAVDLRGHGRSTNPSGRFAIRSCAHDVYALLDRLGIDRFAALGLSLGAKTLLHMATQQPRRPRALVLVSAAPYFPEPARAIMRQSSLAAVGPDELRALRERHVHGDAQIEALFATARGFADSHDDMNFTPPLLGTIAARTLVVHGDRDPLYPVELALSLHRAIAASALLVLPNEGHAPIFGTWKEPFRDAALAFLRGR
jgi:pimeloyl-ACP methyl ester carboxylesterase